MTSVKEKRAVRISVVIATYNRADGLSALLDDLAVQRDAPAFEAVVVDDGSKEPVAPRLASRRDPFPLTVLTRENGGAAVARQAGVEAARGDIIVILDDDMRIGAEFLARHARHHADGAQVVLGHIRAPDAEKSDALFERFHLDQLARFVDGVARGAVAVRGVHLCTGNVSFRRSLFFDVGGFDATLKRSEDRELGVRFEKAGARLAFAVDAVSEHVTDHTRLDVWLRRAFLYGVYDSKIAKKHVDVENADPWSFFFLVSPLSRPLLALAAAFPALGAHARARVLDAAFLVDKLPIGPAKRAALMGATLGYGLEYFRGMREEAGSRRALARGFAGYLVKRGERDERAWARFVVAVRADYDALARHKAKYFDEKMSYARLPVEAVTKIGLQMMLAIRVMHFFRDRGDTLTAQIVSRLIRHLYAAEIHWDADVKPGVALVHGNGLVLSHAARVDEGCILFHEVTLGEGIDPVTRAVGGPHLERDVHVGPGAKIIGPITIGEGSKIGANCVVTTSIPAYSLVAMGEQTVTARSREQKGKGVRARGLA